MKSSMLRLTASAVFASIAAMGAAQQTYTWSAGFGVDFAAPGSWTPARNTPAPDDILVFPAGGWAIEEGFEANHSFGKLLIEDGATLFIQNSLDEDPPGTPLDEGVIWELTGGADALVVEAGATLVLQGNRTFSIELAPGSTGYVEGEVQAYSRASGNTQALIANDAESLEFRDGSVFSLSPGTLPSGLLTTGAREGFSTSADRTTATNSVHFRSGSTYVRGGLIDGTRTGSTGSTPLNFNTDPDIIIFDRGSTYLHLHGRISFPGRAWPTVIFREAGGRTGPDSIALGAGSGSPITINGDLIFDEPGGSWIRDDRSIDDLSEYEWRVFGQNEEGSVATLIDGDFIIRENSVTLVEETGLPSTNIRYADIKGDWIIEDPALFLPVSAAQRRFRLNSQEGPQSLDVNGLSIPRMDFSNPSGVNLASDVEFYRNVRFPEGPVFTNGHRFAVTEWDNSGDIIVASVLTEGTGWVEGTLERTVDATDTGARFFPMGIGSRTGLRITITEAGTGFGTISVTIQNSPPSVPAGFGPTSYVPGSVFVVDAVDVSGFTAEVELNYDPAQTGGLDPENFVVGRFDGSTWEVIDNTDDSTTPYIVRDTENNQVIVHGVTEFSTWALFDAEATSVQTWEQY